MCRSTPSESRRTALSSNGIGPLRRLRGEVLVYGTIDWVELGQIHWRVKEVSPDVPIEVVQQRTLD